MQSLGQGRAPLRLRRRQRVWPRLLAWALVLLLLAGGGAGWLLWRTLPPAADTAAIPGLAGPVEITLDAQGVPRIRAGNERDAAAALGWLHARDRLFQMEMMRRGAAGRLAEIAGPALVPTDRYLRTLGLARRAEADLAALPPDTRAVLEAYASGVNAWIDRHGRFAAPEFLALGQPEPWLPEHSLLWGKVMGLWLSANFRDELERVRLATLLPADRIGDLWPAEASAGRPDWPFAGRPPAPPAPEPEPEPAAAPPPPATVPAPPPAPARPGQPPGAPAAPRNGQPVATPAAPTAAPATPRPPATGPRPAGTNAPSAPPTAPSIAPAPPAPAPRPAAPGRQGVLGEQAGRLLAALPAFPAPFTLPSSASNSWLVGPGRSASGAPLLASDPHLGFQAPILWYLARIELPGEGFLAGATAPGVPFMIIGRNEHLAWGFTNNGADVQDLFIERALDATHYQTPEGPRPFGVAEERILVRGAEPVALRVRETRHGPVLSDLDDMPQGQVLALAAANLAPGDTAAAGLLALNRARSLAEARAAAALISSPVQNLAVAEASGGIALYTTGRVPLRRAGNGAAPAPGHDGSHDWTGWAAPEALPATENPETGLIANGNNRTAPPDFPVFMGRDWFADWRFRRIGERLGQEGRLDAAAMAAAQLDATSLLARAALAEDGPLKRLPPQQGATQAALELLLAWQGEMAAPLPQPLIFNAWKRHFARAALLAGGLPESGLQGRLPGWPPEFIASLWRRPELAARWCRGDCIALAAEALQAAVAELQQVAGPDPAAWRWGSLHRATFEHALLSRLPLLGPLLGRLETETAGDAETLSRGGLRGGPGAEGFRHVHGAGLRFVADLASPDGALAIIATGQSGHPLSRHWADLLAPWRDGDMLRLGREPAEVIGRISLRP